MSQIRIHLSRPHMGSKEKEYVKKAFDSGFITPLGPQLDAFESCLQKYLGGDTHCVGVSSGSAALHLALRIVGVKSGDEVWVSSMTFAGGVFPVNYLNAKPRFIDLSRDSWTIDVDIIESALRRAAKVKSLPAAIVPTDLYGQSVDLNGIEYLSVKYGVPVVVDSAESLGAKYLGGRKAGTGGNCSILSFNGNKIITTSGGGMLVTTNPKWAADARYLATQARDSAPHYEHSTFGYNYRLSNICAAIGIGQMEVLDARVAKRRQIFEKYSSALGSHPGLSFMPEPIGYFSSRWLTALTIDPQICGVDREHVRKYLLSHGIESRPLWKPMHLQPIYRGSAYEGSGFDETLFRDGLCLPSGSDMLESEQDEVIGHIRELLH